MFFLLIKSFTKQYISNAPINYLKVETSFAKFETAKKRGIFLSFLLVDFFDNGSAVMF